MSCRDPRLSGELGGQKAPLQSREVSPEVLGKEPKLPQGNGRLGNCLRCVQDPYLDYGSEGAINLTVSM